MEQQGFFLIDSWDARSQLSLQLPDHSFLSLFITLGLGIDTASIGGAD